eukprot:3939257-Amphidinium_carterae.1
MMPSTPTSMLTSFQTCMALSYITPSKVVRKRLRGMETFSESSLFTRHRKNTGWFLPALSSFIGCVADWCDGKTSMLKSSKLRH